MTQTIDTNRIDEFANGFRGEIVRPGDAGYDDLRKVFNGMIDHKPALIARPRDTADVQRAVDFGRDGRLEISVRGGGHGVNGYAVTNGGLMIDLQLMKGIKVDPQSRTAVAEGGVNWGEFDAATQAHGLAVTGGRMTTTGIAGLTLGSGSGWLERKLGYTVDNLLGAEVVLADGSVVQASAEENTELFWGLRGGGGNFGIVTSFRFRLHPIGPIVYGGLLGFPRVPQVLKAYRDFMETAPDDVGGAAALITAPSEEIIPPPVRGLPVMAVVVCYTGDPEKGAEAIRPLLDLGPVLNMVQPMPYTAVQQLLDMGNPPGMQNYWKAEVLPSLPDEAIDALLAAAAQPASPLAAVIIQPAGGAIQRQAEDATAMGWRKAKWVVHILGLWTDASADAENIAWVRRVSEVLKPWAQDGAYLNYLMDEGEDRVRASFGPHYGRMVALKDKYDPANVFHLNQNIKPSK